MKRSAVLTLVAVLAGVLLADYADAQTYRKSWTLTSDFNEGANVNTNQTSPPDQVQLNLDGIETPYLWVANSSSGTLARISTETGRVLSISTVPGGSPSRTAVDLNFDCWTGNRQSNGPIHKYRAADGAYLGSSEHVGVRVRGIAINAAGEVWASTSEGDNPRTWLKINPEQPPIPGQAFETLTTIGNNYGSYGIAIDAFGRMFSTTAWIGGTRVQRFDADTGAIQQVWQHGGYGGNVYGLTVDIDGNPWGAVWRTPYVLWFNGSYECPDGALDCAVSCNGSTSAACIDPDGSHGLKGAINVQPAIEAAGGGHRIGGRGIAVDANGFVWAVFNDTTNVFENRWTLSPSYAVKIDRTTGQVVSVTRVGIATVGITPDARGFIWVVNYGGGGANLVNHPCPDGHTGNGTVTKIRSSDGRVVETYPTCGTNPYTYSDMAGYNLRSVTLRSGRWTNTHDSGRPNLEWGNIRWTEETFDDTTFRVRYRIANTEADLANQEWVEVTNGGELNGFGQFIEVEAFFFTRNDFIGPVLKDLTVSSVCIPAPESCNGFDDDCNGSIDDLPANGPCDTGLPGVCSAGENRCIGGEFQCVPTQLPEDEVCDGEDNNCDGRTDEGVSNLCGTCGPAPEELCDGIDQDCDDSIDEGVTNACGTCGPDPAEICDGVDNNCNGLIDEGVTNLCGTCGPAPTEICDGEDNDCDGLEDEAVTNACGGCGPAPTEICDGLDNNCDGRFDEGLLNRCGTCGPAPVEVCDGQDNDCDGDTDEGVLNACGFCGEVPEEVCDGEDNNCDGNIDEGLTNACGGCGDVPEEICNGLDDDCDGDTDEGVLNRCGGCGLLPEEVCNGIDDDCDGDTDEDVKNACGGCGPLSPDVCDAFDNDCDGQIDEDPDCTEGRTCIMGECAEPCAAGECPRGFFCNEDNFCLADRCTGVQCGQGRVCDAGSCVDAHIVACRDVVCEGEEVCVEGNCQADPCQGVSCEAGQACWLGTCEDESVVACRQVECSQGEVCQDGACVQDPCVGAQCEAGQLCIDGVCDDACNHTTCGTGFECRLGRCVEDRCFNVTCEDGKSCHLGNCVFQGCENVVCGDNEQCGSAGCEPVGTCGDAVCVDGEVCASGTCVPESDEIAGGNNGQGQNNQAGNNGQGENNNAANNGGDGGGGDGAGGGDPGSDSGCGCSVRSSGGPTSSLLWLFALGAVWAWRRRS